MFDRMTPPSLSRRDVLRGLAAAGIGTVVGAGTHGFLYERFRVDVARTTLAVSGLPDGLSGVRVGFLTDLHRSGTVPHELIDRAVGLLMAERPDLIILGGDYITMGERRFAEPAAEALSRLSAPNGVFGVLGNHDDDRDVPAALSARGFEILRDERTRITIRGDTLDLIGIRYWTSKVADIARLARGASPASMLIAHTPSRLREATALALPLMLSGHTHGGQVVLPGLGAIAARRFPVIAGAAYKENTTAYVSRGIGTVYVPVRVACPPEVSILTLKPKDLA